MAKKDKKGKKTEKSEPSEAINTTETAETTNAITAAALGFFDFESLESSEATEEKKSKKGKKKGKKDKTKNQKTEEDIFLEQLTAIVNERLKEKWDALDAQTKKKLTGKEKARQTKRRNDELKQAVEAERLRLIEEEKRQQELERQLAAEKEQRDIIEQGIRERLLRVSCNNIRKLQKKALEKQDKIVANEEWKEYIKCDGLPDVSNCGDLHTYLHLWEKVKDLTTPASTIQRSADVLQIMEHLDRFLDNSSGHFERNMNWHNVRTLFRDYLQEDLNSLAYRLLRDIHHNLMRLNISTAQQVVIDPNNKFKLYVWAKIQLPIPLPNPKRSPDPQVELNFEEINLQVLFPPHMDVWAMCVRAMFIAYDHISHKTASAYMPRIPAPLKQTLLEITTKEWEEKQNILKEERKRVKDERDKAARAAIAFAQNTESEEAQQAAKAAINKQKEYIKVDYSAIYITKEDEIYASFREQLSKDVEEHVVNLRKYSVIGGIFYLGLYYQPPQPSTMVLSDITMTTLQIPKTLSSVPFHYTFEPPPPPPPGTIRSPEEIEEELRQIESEFEQMLHVTLKLSSEVFWLEPPIACQWDEDLHLWTTKDVHDTKFNEEKLTLQFKTGTFGMFSTAIIKANCLPFQAWELKPGEPGQVLMTIMSSILVFEFTITEDGIYLNQVQNAPNSALDYLIGKCLPYLKLRREMRIHGANIFPNNDIFCYLEGLGEKQWPLEFHVYYNIAQLSMIYNFAWSRWNLTAGRRNIVTQMREWNSIDKKQMDFSMCLITPVRSILVNCTEVSPSFSSEPKKRMKFFPDLYHMVYGIATTTTICKLEKTPPNLVNNVADLLKGTRIFSLS